ncbi:MAG: ice-binding family protein [Byssovorax sp.]
MHKLGFALASLLLVSVTACGESTEAQDTQDTQDSADLQQAAFAAKTSCALTPVNLRTAAPFAVLAGSTVTNTGATTVTGDLGISPGTALTGFGPGTVVGTMHLGDPTAAQAEADLTTAYNDAAGRVLCPVSISGNLGGLTLAPGLYKSTSGLAISSGDLTLDAKGKANAVFIFQMASTLTTSAGRQVILKGGALAANVFWQVGSSATLGTTTKFKGNIMAYQAITLQTGATLNGRALARVAAVAMDTDTVTKP